MITQKQINKQIYYILCKPSVRKINRFLNLAYKIGASEKPFKVKISHHESMINDLRKEWKELRDLAEQKRLEYVETKGDFYK